MVFIRSYGMFPLSVVDASNVVELENKLNLPEGFKLFKNGRVLDSQQTLEDNDYIDIIGSLVGGKGGFGSMLRALGNQIQKTTNKEACRDLSGRRLRDINEEKRLKNFVSKKAEREREKQEKKEAKLKKLHKLVTEGESKHEFSDPKYDEAREAATDRVHEAMNQVFSDPDLKPSTSGTKRKAEEEKKPVKQPAAKKGLWIGADINESDLEDSSEEEGEGSA